MPLPTWLAPVKKRHARRFLNASKRAIRRRANLTRKPNIGARFETRFMGGFPAASALGWKKTVLLPDEDQEGFRPLARRLVLAYAPCGVLEEEQGRSARRPSALNASFLVTLFHAPSLASKIHTEPGIVGGWFGLRSLSQ